MIAYIKHIAIEGPETLGKFFEGHGFESRTIELYNGGVLPESLDGIDAVVSLGGPMNVYEEDRYPFLREENAFLRKVLEREVPFLGICLGSQLLAKAGGARVGKSPEKEIGLFPVSFTEEGKSDPLFAGLDGDVNVFQWHEDMSDLPPGASLLATSQGCPHQAFRVGANAYGLQFHVEVTGATIDEWCAAYFSEDDSFRQQHRRLMLRDYEQKQGVFRKTAETVYRNFLKIIENRRANH